jgi:phosphatidylserine/phosphatidylglycerophosphate/cardiolipin synthase-like enzyme
MLVAHEQHTGTLLADGRVLLAGGANWAAELYDPVTDQFKAIGNSIDVRIEHTSTRLANGDVLITGGSPDTTAELYRSPSGQ